MDQKSIQILLDDLKHEDKSKRANAVGCLVQISRYLGQDRTRNELIPFINQELTDDEDDEILIVLARQISNLTETLGNQAYCSLLFPSLEILFQNQDSGIRLEAIQSMRKVLNILNIKTQEEIIMMMIKRCAQSEYFNQKHACSFLIPTIYPHVSSSNQNECINLLLNFANDQSSIVRKFVSMAIKDLIPIMNNVHEDQVLFIFQKLCRDDQDYIRIYLIDALVELAKDRIIQKHKQNVLQLTKIFAEDSSWRVKYVICDQLPNIVKNLDKDTIKNNFLQYYTQFLKDDEPEMRSKAAEKLDLFCQYLDTDTIQSKIFPYIKILAVDHNNFVRASLSKSLLHLSPQFGKKKSMEIIVPIFISLIKDNDSSIRLNLLNNIQGLIKVIGIESLTNQIVPAIKDLTEDKNWRNRVSAMEFLPLLCEQLADNEKFVTENLLKYLINLSKDKIYTVRVTTIQVFKSLIQTFGSRWTENQIFPKIIPLQQSPNYLYRVTLLMIIREICSVLNQDQISKVIIPVLLALSRDSVANVRLNAAHSLFHCYQYSKEKEIIKNTLQTLIEDQDFDVNFFSRKNLLAIS